MISRALAAALGAVSTASLAGASGQAMGLVEQTPAVNEIMQGSGLAFALRFDQPIDHSRNRGRSRILCNLLLRSVAASVALHDVGEPRARYFRSLRRPRSIQLDVAAQPALFPRTCDVAPEPICMLYPLLLLRR